MRLSELAKKDVININDGSKIGNITDILIDDKGYVLSLVVDKSNFSCSFFTAKDEMLIDFNNIEKIGEDVIIVKIEKI